MRLTIFPRFHPRPVGTTAHTLFKFSPRYSAVFQQWNHLSEPLGKQTKNPSFNYKYYHLRFKFHFHKLIADLVCRRVLRPLDFATKTVIQTHLTWSDVIWRLQRMTVRIAVFFKFITVCFISLS